MTSTAAARRASVAANPSAPPKPPAPPAAAPKPEPRTPQVAKPAVKPIDKSPPKPEVATRIVSTAKPLPKQDTAAAAATTPPPKSKPLPAAPAVPAAAADPDKARREAELRARLAAEEHADALRASGAVASWTQNIRGKVERAWLRPPSVTAALDCIVRVTQVPGGEVVRVEIQACNGDASARESIEAAVYRASPLPQPVDASLFERIIEFRFHPSE